MYIYNFQHFKLHNYNAQCHTLSQLILLYEVNQSTHTITTINPDFNV